MRHSTIIHNSIKFNFTHVCYQDSVLSHNNLHRLCRMIDRLKDTALRIIFDSEQKELCRRLFPSGDFKHHRSGPIVLKRASAFLALIIAVRRGDEQQRSQPAPHKNQSGRSRGCCQRASEMLGKNSLVTKFSACV